MSLEEVYLGFRAIVDKVCGENKDHKTATTIVSFPYRIQVA